MNKRMLSFLSVTVAAIGLIAAPCLAAPPTATAPAKPPETVLKLISANKDLSKFADLISSADAEKEFETKGSMITVFAPSNAAMDKIPSDVMKRAKAEKDGLKKLALYHTIIGSQVMSGNIQGRKAGPSTGAGEMIGFDGTGKDLKVNDAVITTKDLIAQNGVVHIIDKPLLIPSLAVDKEKAAEEERKKMEEERKKMEEQMKKDAPPSAPAKAAAPETPKAPEAAPPAEPAAPGAPAAPAAPKKEEKGLLKKLFGR